ncbi:hypothetical protein BX666DRAFT_1392856 [Dichotomocladium elegans]|nr:hypothetical protein BX666DRAFT_1392856 [Dichotomocladium elegans]
MSFSTECQKPKTPNSSDTTGRTNNAEEQNGALRTTKTLLRTRRRGKTLPGSLATPPPVPYLPLPPLKVEPVGIVSIPSNDANHGKAKPISATIIACPDNGVTSCDDLMMSTTPKVGNDNHRSSMPVTIRGSSVSCLSRHTDQQRHGSISGDISIDDGTATGPSTFALSKSQSLPVVDKNIKHHSNETHHLLSPKFHLCMPTSVQVLSMI